MSAQDQVVSVLHSALDGTVSLGSWNALVESAGSRVDLRGVELENANLTGLTFRDCDLDGARIEKCRLVGVCFQGSSLDNVVFKGSNLRGASFVRATARGADFREAQIAEADFSWCDLKNARLDGSDLTGVTLWKTDLRGAHFPEFTPLANQHFLSDREQSGGGRPTSVSIAAFAKAVGGMLGVPHRWVGKGSFDVDWPRRVEDPNALLNETLGKYKLTVLPRTDDSGQLLYYEMRSQLD